MKRLFFVVIAVMALWGCNDSSNNIDPADNTGNIEEELDTGTFPSNYFITNYIVPSKIQVANPYGILCLEIGGSDYRTLTEYKNTFNFKKALEFAEFYGDTSYRGSVIPGMSRSLAYPIDKITLYCTKDFDTEHSAGEPLDDVVKLKFKTICEYVKNGYKIPEEISRENTEDGFKVIHSLNFEDVNADVTTLVHVSLFNTAQWGHPATTIHFASAPAEPGEYWFVLETTINGKVYKSEFTYTFE